MLSQAPHLVLILTLSATQMTPLSQTLRKCSNLTCSILYSS
uniref:Uncharacterized protein n=1 Tax=Anguilla anguilla TaxID=7936 RepID=A0A0E9UXZ9_ANGAN